MKATIIKATVFTNGELRKIFVPRKVTQGELSRAIKSDTVNFSEKAKLVEYEICKITVELTKETMCKQVVDVLKESFGGSDTLTYIM